jgi:cytochrome P450
MRYIGIGGGERVLISSPESLKEVLVTQQYKFFDRPTMARKRIAMQARNRLITSSGEVHKQQKRKLTPAFSSRAIKELHPLYWSKANELAEAISKRIQSSDSASIDILSWTSRSALDIIGTAAWGQDFNAISEPDSDFLKTYSAMFDISGGGPLMSALALAIPMSYLLYIPVPYNKRLRAALKAIRTRCTHAVKEKKQMALEGKDTYKDILSLLIQGGIEDEEALINQMMTILAAGHDTSSLSLAWGLYLLCKYPDVQTKLREELRSQLPLGSYGSTDEIIPEMLEDLPYLSAVANEILRLMPSVHTTRREALNDTTVEGYFIPRDGHMVISGWVCNRLELEWGTDAEQFVPDRWLNTGKDEDSSTSVNNKFAFNSFSHGARSCIGQGFARGEFLVFLATLVGCFEMELEDPSKEPVALFGITMSPAEEIRIKFTQVI